MLTITDVRERQVVFIRSTEGELKNITILNGCLVVSEDGIILHKVPLVKISACIVVGSGTLTTNIISQIIEHGGSLLLSKPSFAVYASFHANANGNYLLRSVQYRALPQQEFEWARALVLNKINCQLKEIHHLREDLRPELVTLIKKTKIMLACATNSDTLRGIEGTIQKYYFSALYKEHGWLRRLPQSKLDPINVLLDIGYSMLFHLTDCFLQLFGFDTYKGFYHTLFFQRKSLACDAMEPFRVLIDRTIRKMYSLKQIDFRDFEQYGPNYNLPWAKSGKYYKLFTQELMEYREELYLYCQKMHRHFVKPDMYPFPQFNYKPYR
jgi:CRISP-associated protein Cas1